MIGALRAEWLKARKRPAVYVLLAVLLAVLVLLFYFLLWYLFTYRAQEILRGSPPGVRAQDIKQLLYPQHFLQEMLSAARQVGGPICLILGVQMAGSDYGWGTWKTVFTQRPPRLAIWAAKVVVMLVLLAIGTVLFVAVAAGCSAAVAAVDGVSSPWPSLGDTLRAACAAWLIFAMWASMGIFLAVLFQQSALAVGLGLVYLLVLESVVLAVVGLSPALTGIEKPFPGVNATALSEAFNTVRATGLERAATPLVGATQATLVLAAYCLAFLGLGGVLVRQRDVI